MRTLAISPELRPQSMEAMAQELGKLSGATPAQEQPLHRHRSGAAQQDAVRGGGAGGGGAAGGRHLVRRRSHERGAVAGGAADRGRGGGPGGGGARFRAPPAQPQPTVFAPTTIGQPHPEAPTKVITVERPVVLKPAAPGGGRSEPKATAPAAPPNPALALAEARRMLGKAHEATVDERYAEAEELYNRVRATGLERGSALTGLAEVAFQRGQYPEAVRLGHWARRRGRQRRGQDGPRQQLLQARQVRRSHLRSIARCCRPTPAIARPGRTSPPPRSARAAELLRQRQRGIAPGVCSASPLGIHSMVPSG